MLQDPAVPWLRISGCSVPASTSACWSEAVTEPPSCSPPTSLASLASAAGALGARFACSLDARLDAAPPPSVDLRCFLRAWG